MVLLSGGNYMDVRQVAQWYCPLHRIASMEVARAMKILVDHQVICNFLNNRLIPLLVPCIILVSGLLEVAVEQDQLSKCTLI